MVNSSYSYGPPLSLLWTHFCGQLVSFSSVLGLLFHKVGLFCCISVWCRAGSVQQIFRLKQKTKKKTLRTKTKQQDTNKS